MFLCGFVLLNLLIFCVMFTDLFLLSLFSSINQILASAIFAMSVVSKYIHHFTIFLWKSKMLVNSPSKQTFPYTIYRSRHEYSTHSAHGTLNNNHIINQSIYVLIMISYTNPTIKPGMNSDAHKG